MFIDVHVVQTVPLANLNRDDTGSPKSMPYGGVRRLRVSSQAWKRATREALEAADLAGVTYRSRHPDVRLAELLEVRGFSADAAVAVARWAFASLGTAASKEGSNVILFASEVELVVLADLLAAHQAELSTAVAEFVAAAQPDQPSLLAEGESSASVPQATTKAKGKAKSKPTGPDFASAGVSASDIKRVFTAATHADAIGLFGRMLAANPAVNVDAAVQVAHAFSVHPAAVEFDYFTAVEDIPIESEGAGAGMVETGEFASGTLYRYATVDVDELVRNCGGDLVVARALAEVFIKAFTLSIPSGKKNATAPNTVPGLVVVTARSDRPVSYAAAFEKPVGAKGGFEDEAVARMASYAARVARMVEAPVSSAVVNLTDVDVSTLGILADHVNTAAASVVSAAL